MKNGNKTSPISSTRPEIFKAFLFVVFILFISTWGISKAQTLDSESVETPVVIISEENPAATQATVETPPPVSIDTNIINSTSTPDSVETEIKTEDITNPNPTAPQTFNPITTVLDAVAGVKDQITDLVDNIVENITEAIFATPEFKIKEESTNIGKIVVVSAVDVSKKGNILVYTKIPEIYDVAQEYKIQIKLRDDKNTIGILEESASTTESTSTSTEENITETEEVPEGGTSTPSNIIQDIIEKITDVGDKVVYAVKNVFAQVASVVTVYAQESTSTSSTTTDAILVATSTAVVEVIATSTDTVVDVVTDQNVAFKAYDTDGNGKLDRIEWTVPDLSKEQIYEITYVSKVFKLDSNQNIKADIFDSLKIQDDKWATVESGQFLKVAFNENKDSTKDITIYARPASISSQSAQANSSTSTNYSLAINSPSIEVYPVYTDEKGNQTKGPLLGSFKVVPKPEVVVPQNTQDNNGDNSKDIENINDVGGVNPDNTNYVKSKNIDYAGNFIKNITEKISNVFNSQFENSIDHEDSYNISLTSLATSTNIFYLKVNGNVAIDYISNPADNLTISNEPTTNGGIAPNYIAGLGGGNINAQEINTLLNEGKAVTISAEGNININKSINKTEGEDAILTLSAGNSIVSDAEINSTSDIILKSEIGNTPSGRVEIKKQIKSNTKINLSSGVVMLDADALLSSNEVNVNAKNILQQGSIKATNIKLNFTSAYIDREKSLTEGNNIYLNGSQGNESHIFASGKYDVSGDDGGNITFEALQSIKLYGAKLNASGSNRGGIIKIGGDFQGGGEMKQSKETVINPTTSIKANGGNGNGGTIIVWSNEKTRFDGMAQANSTDGNGGNIEISSKQNLSVLEDATTEATSDKASAGTVLFDPKNITISSAGSTPESGSPYYFELVDPNFDTGEFGNKLNGNGNGVQALSSGNVVVTDILDDLIALDAGAAYLFNGATGALVSTLTGSTASDNVGISVVALTNGNYVVNSGNWNRVTGGALADVGAVTWGNGTTGITGVVSVSNSLIGGTVNDNVGFYGIISLTNGNYVVRNFFWDRVTGGALVDVGAVTWGNGTTGTVGVVSASNSLIGSTASDQVGSHGITALTNGNYMVISGAWDRVTGGALANVGAATWGNGTTGTVGVVSVSNSLIGGTVNDNVGGSGITALTNGNYVVNSYNWDRVTGGALANVGAATWGNGTTGTVGVVSASNSLIGGTASNFVGYTGITALTNGNYVVSSSNWDRVTGGALANVGAVTWGNGTTGTVGVVSEANSLIGGTVNDNVGGSGITALTNGNYVMGSGNWDRVTGGALANVGATTWGNGTTGTIGVVSVSNSLIGGTVNDYVGSSNVIALTNGNYVVGSGAWDRVTGGALANVGAATWGNGTTGTVGVVSEANSLIGGTASDYVGHTGIDALTNGNYVVRNYFWDRVTGGALEDVGAVTWGNGTTGTVGVVSVSNSLIGGTASDQVGSSGITALTNGNYVVRSQSWDRVTGGALANVGAVTWGNGTTGTVGVVSEANSLIGSTENDYVCSIITALTNGNYVMGSGNWDNGSLVDAGAVTIGNGTYGTVGTISTSNSIIGPVEYAYLSSFTADTVNNHTIVAFIAVTAQKVYSISNNLFTSNPSDYTFSYDTGATYTLTPAFLTNALNAGTNVIMQASNDITISNTVTANNAGGDGGDLTLQAGRSILVNANVTTDNGDLNLYANEKASAGVVDADRASGTAVITMAGGTALNAGTGALNIKLDDGTGNTNKTAGDITLMSLAGATSTITNTNAGGNGAINDVSTLGNLTLNLPGTLTLGGALNVTGNLNIATGTLDVSATGCSGSSCAISLGGNFTNPVGVSGFNARTGTVTVNGTNQLVLGTTTFNILAGVGSIFEIPSNVTVATNNTTITTNNGTLTTNTTTGTVLTNNFIITTNNGVVTTNASSGTIGINNLTVTSNEGTVTTNTSLGTIGTNSGTLTNPNLGTITINNSSLDVNNSIVGTNNSGKTITTNNGTVGTNNGLITTNNSTITTNNGTITTNAFGATITNNLGSIHINNGTTNANTFDTGGYNSALGLITGDATFSYLNTTTATSGIVIDTTGYANGTVLGTTTDSLGRKILTWVFNDTDNNGIVSGDALFDNSTRNVGVVTGNAIFNNSATNVGTVSGNADVYFPVARPLGGTISGITTFHDYPGFYFKDKAPMDGNWSTTTNWWTDNTFTTNTSDIPHAGDDVYVYSDISTTTVLAYAKNVTFYNGSKNSITINASGEVIFNATSSNESTGSIIASSITFMENLAENIGTVTGTLIRKFTNAVNIGTRNFTTDNWTVIAQGVVVNISDAIYYSVTNIFKALNGGSFITNPNINGGASVVPDILTTLPTNGQAVTKWLPSISWGISTLCEYSYNNWASTTVANCVNAGADISRPATTSNTLSLRGTSAGNVAEKNISFTYNNTVAIPTSCGSDLLDENRDYYYLTENTFADCIISANTSLRGASSSLSPGFTLTGDVLAGAQNISLSNIIIDGIASSTGDVTTASSTMTGVVDVVGNWALDEDTYIGGATIRSGATLSGGNFSGDVLNNGEIVTNTLPTIVLGNTTNNGIITGNYIFNATSTNSGIVSGISTLNGISVNIGTTTTLILNTLTATSGVVTFSGNTSFLGTGHVTGLIKDSLGTTISKWVFRNSSTNSGFTKGTAILYDTSANTSTVSGDAHFSDASTNSGTVTGTADIYYPHIMPMTGGITGVKTYHSYTNSPSFRNISLDNDWNNISNWFAFATTSVPLSRTPITGENITLFASTTLSSNITNDIYIADNNITLNGFAYNLTGSISGNGAYGGHNAYNFNLANIAVTGTTSAIGGDGYDGVNGGVGGTINIDNSSTGGIVVNGGDPRQDGGDAGTSTITNSFAIVEGTRILAVGGASAGCGFGGNGGNISLIDSSGYVLVTATGMDATSTCDVVPPAPTNRSGGIATQVGIYISPATRAANAAAAAAANNRPTSSSGGVDPYFAGLINAHIGKLNLANLPSISFGGLGVGSNLGVSNLVNPLADMLRVAPISGFSPLPKLNLLTKLDNFLNNSLPKSLADLSNTIPFLKREFLTFGIRNGYDLYIMKESPVNTPTMSDLAKDKTKQPESLMFVSIDGKERQTKLSIDGKGNVYQIITVEPYSVLGVSAKNTSRVVPKASLNNTDMKVVKDKQNIIKLSVVAPKDNGSYTLKVGALTLQVKVEKAIVPAGGGATTGVILKKLSPIQKLWSWFGK